MIKPRTTLNNRNEFNVVISKTAGIDIANMSLFPKPVLHSAQETILAEKQAEIDKLKKELKREQEVLEDLKKQEREAQQKKRSQEAYGGSRSNSRGKSSDR